MILLYLPAVGTVVLTMMGAMLATRLLGVKQKHWWRAAFLVVGVITALGQVYVVHSQREASNQISSEIRGSASVYFVADTASSQLPDGFKITAFNSSTFPVTILSWPSEAT